MKIDKTCRIGRTYEDFKTYSAEHPDLPISELDSVEGIRGGSVLLTIHFVRAKLQLAFLRQSNDSASVTRIFEDLLQLLGICDYRKILSLLLADNGSEFSDPKAIEFEYKGERISRLFYCDPSAPGQKGHCENNHEFIRRIIPKGKDLGQYTQSQIKRAGKNYLNEFASGQRDTIGIPDAIIVYQYALICTARIRIKDGRKEGASRQVKINR